MLISEPLSLAALLLTLLTSTYRLHQCFLLLAIMRGRHDLIVASPMSNFMRIFVTLSLPIGGQSSHFTTGRRQQR